MVRNLEKSAARGKLYVAVLGVAMGIALFQPDGALAGETQPVESIPVETFDKKIKASHDDALILVLAAWCAPCRKELPLWVDLYNQYKSKGLNLIGMSIDYGGVDAIQPMIDRHGVSFPVYWVGEKGIETYGISAIPLVMVVEKGEISDRIAGIQTKEQLEGLVRRVID